MHGTSYRRAILARWPDAQDAPNSSADKMFKTTGNSSVLSDAEAWDCLSPVARMAQVIGAVGGLDVEKAFPIARAAIEALREPTAHMVRAGTQYFENASQQDVEDAWDAMISAAQVAPAEQGWKDSGTNSSQTVSGADKSPDNNSEVDQSGQA